MNLLSSLRRRPASGHYVPEIDGLRFLSIAWVVVGHIYHYWSASFTAAALQDAGWPKSLQSILRHNGVGVLFFFAISGYVLAVPFANQGARRCISLRNYYLRRLVRIEPPYLIVTTAILVLYALRDSSAIQQFLPHYAASMGYLHNVIFPAESGLNAIAWSLEIEIQFYLFAPLLFRVFRLPARVSQTLLAAGIVASFLLPMFWTPGFITLYNYLGYFLIGCLLAGTRAPRSQGLKESPGTNWLLTALAVLATMVVGPLGYLLQETVYVAVTPLCILAVMAAALAPTPVRSLLRWSPLAVIGGTCYSIYLTHSLLLAALVSRGLYPFAESLEVWAFGAAAVVLSAAVLLVGIVVYKAVEQPFMQLSARYRLVEKRDGTA